MPSRYFDNYISIEVGSGWLGMEVLQCHTSGITLELRDTKWLATIGYNPDGLIF